MRTDEMRHELEQGRLDDTLACAMVARTKRVLRLACAVAARTICVAYYRSDLIKVYAVKEK